MAIDNQNTESDQTSAQNDIQVVTSKGHIANRRPLLIVVLAVVGLVLIGLVFVYLLPHSNDDEKSKNNGSERLTISSVCDADTIREASSLIYDNDITNLEATANKIKSLKNYRGDVNCNYILTRYYIMIGDIDHSKSTLADLKQTYAHVGEYSSEFDPPAVAIRVLEGYIDSLVEQNKQMVEQNKQNFDEGIIDNEN